MKLTEHARDRMTEMGVDRDEVYATIRRPDFTYPGGPSHAPQRTVLVRGRLVVVTDRKWIVTLLWHGRSGRDGIAVPFRADV